MLITKFDYYSFVCICSCCVCYELDICYPLFDPASLQLQKCILNKSDSISYHAHVESCKSKQEDEHTHKQTNKTTNSHLMTKPLLRIARLVTEICNTTIWF